MFGTSFIDHRDHTSSIVASFLASSRRTDPVNRHIKTIARTNAIGIVGIHDVQLTHGVAVDTKGHPQFLGTKWFSDTGGGEYLFRINHYHSKSVSEFQLKIERGRADEKQIRNEGYHKEVIKLYNDIINVQIVQFLLFTLAGSEPWKIAARKILLTGINYTISSLDDVELAVSEIQLRRQKAEKNLTN